MNRDGRLRALQHGYEKAAWIDGCRALTPHFPTVSDELAGNAVGVHLASCTDFLDVKKSSLVLPC